MGVCTRPRLGRGWAIGQHALAHFGADPLCLRPVPVVFHCLGGDYWAGSVAGGQGAISVLNLSQVVWNFCTAVLFSVKY